MLFNHIALDNNNKNNNFKCLELKENNTKWWSAHTAFRVGVQQLSFEDIRLSKKNELSIKQWNWSEEKEKKANF